MSDNVVEGMEGLGETEWFSGLFAGLTTVEAIKGHGRTKWHGGRVVVSNNVVEETKGYGGTDFAPRDMEACTN